jgi:predicted RNA-binding Zn ribbon-like protein
MPAHYEIVDGIPLPAKLGGHPALDFCNTWAGWDGHEPHDYLQSYDHLALWTGFVGLLPTERVGALRQRDGRRGDAALERARLFRGSLYSVLTEGPATSAWAAVREVIQAAAAALIITRTDESVWWEMASESDLEAPLLSVAWSAAGFLASPDLLRVKACPGRGCGWLFLDRRGRRRWCSMASCGNREKVRRFAARQSHAAE